MKSPVNRIIYIILNAFMVFGFVLPYLISAKSNELVLIGVLILIANTIHLVYFSINTIKLLNDEKPE